VGTALPDGKIDQLAQWLGKDVCAKQLKPATRSTASADQRNGRRNAPLDALVCFGMPLSYVSR
jgi:hypothetical protein